MRSSLLIAQLLVFASLAATVNGKVTVHVVPHTHDDVGWLKTVDEYYTGQNNSIQRAYVKMILDTVVEALQHNPERTFTYVEQAFFQRWWRQQTPEMRKVTQDLVKNGKLSFTNGGWCMHDEAVPFYLDMIDQTTLGHKFLMDEFGVAPKTGWQLDPFGHSASQAALLAAEVGLAGLFIGRIDYQDLTQRVNTKSAEFIWRASPSLGEGAQVFTGLTGEYGGNYGPPPGFDWANNDEPVQDDAALKDYNVQSRVDDFVKEVNHLASLTRGEHVMFTMGSDFQYENAREIFENLDRIIKYTNLDGRVQAKYSTPEMYLEAKAQEKADISYPLKTDDFFPYADGAHQFWTGYFTSRPAFKRYVRDSSAFLQMVKQLGVLGQGPSAANDDGIKRLEEAMGVAQHHDAVAGTAKQHVTFDYAARIAAGRAGAMPGASGSLVQLSGSEAGKLFSYCELRNVSVCGQTQIVSQLGNDAQEIDFVLWNGLAQARQEVVELPVGAGQVQVLDANGGSISSQVVPSLPSMTNYGQDAGGGKQTLLFNAEVPAFGFKAFRLSGDGSLATPPKAELPVKDDTVVLENDILKLEFCDGSLCKMTDKQSGVTVRAEQSWLWYEGSEGNKESDQASGAYIFRPKETQATPVFTGQPDLKVYRGPLADEVHQTFGPWVSQRIRLEKGASHAEITFTVGPIPVGDAKGKEVVSRITTDIKNAGECLSDSNGREMLVRKRDFRPTWKLDQTEPVAGNYYPVTTALAIRDSRVQLTVLTDAAQAGTGCVRDGEVELMAHRALLKDDGRGVTEPLNETQYVTPYAGPGDHGQHYGPGLVIRGKNLLTLTSPSRAAEVWRPAVDQLYMPLSPFFAEGGAKLTRPSFTALAQPLPPNVQIITLEQWDTDRVLVRLAHQFGLDEDAVLSKPATVDLAGLFANRRVLDIDERGLAATISRAEVLQRRIQWRVEGETPAPQPDVVDPSSGASTITLGPLQIRTFLVKLSPSEEATAMFI